MLIARVVDTASVISRVLRLTAFACCALVVVSFAMFARDQVAGASQHQQTELVAGAHPTAATTTPVKHGLPAFFAVLAYGLGLGYLARYSSARA